jgi:uncharacterized membrane protein YgcG
LHEQDIVFLFGMMFGGVWIGLFLVPVLRLVFGAVSSRSLVRAALTVVVLGIIISVFGNFLRVVFSGDLGEVVPAVASIIGENPFPFVLVGSFAALNGLFLYLMRAPTALGRPIMDQLAGLRLYLETAESDRLNLQAPEITAERFEALLPYAVALDVEKPWSDAFAAALQRAHPGEAEPMHFYQPHWRTGSNWSSSDFSSSVASTVSSASAAFASAIPPSSSGSSGFSSGGGGGGSGGGGGGGGGGGW